MNMLTSIKWKRSTAPRKTERANRKQKKQDSAETNREPKSSWKIQRERTKERNGKKGGGREGRHEREQEGRTETKRERRQRNCETKPVLSLRNVNSSRPLVKQHGCMAVGNLCSGLCKEESTAISRTERRGSKSRSWRRQNHASKFCFLAMCMLLKFAMLGFAMTATTLGVSIMIYRECRETRREIQQARAIQASQIENIPQIILPPTDVMFEGLQTCYEKVTVSVYCLAFSSFAVGLEQGRAETTIDGAASRAQAFPS